MSGLVYLEDVVTLQLDRELCIGCGNCEIVCPHAVFHMTDGLAEIQHRDACMECGACALNCEVEAIKVRSGVGCATAVISESLGRTGDCCTVERSN
jgi:NAD-dependent dihydropyrimidine dehydrogenase PreA subunit